MERIGLPFTQVRRRTSVKGAALREDDLEFRVGHVKLARPTGHPSGDGEYM